MMKRPIVLGIALCLVNSSAWSLKIRRYLGGPSERETKREMLSTKLLGLIKERSSQPLSRAGSLQPFTDLLAQGADANSADERNSALHYACYNGDYHLVRLLLDNGARVNAQDWGSGTPLHNAARNGHKEVCELLIGHGAEVNAQISEGFTPLYVAAHKGRKEVCALLIDHGALVNAQDSKGLTPLCMVAQNGDKEVCGL